MTFEIRELKELYGKAAHRDYIYLAADTYEIRIGIYGEADYYQVTKEELNYILN